MVRMHIIVYCGFLCLGFSVSDFVIQSGSWSCLTLVLIWTVLFDEDCGQKSENREGSHVEGR